jgi:hypothetical protein
MLRIIRSIRVLGLLLGAVTVLAASSPVRAQEDLRYNFNLPFDVQWQGTTLAAGAYHFSAQAVSSDQSGVLFIRDAKGQPTVAALPVIVETGGAFSSQSALTIVRRNGKWCVQSLRLGPIGTTRVYPVPRQSKAERELQASGRVIPVQIAKSGS